MNASKLIDHHHKNYTSVFCFKTLMMIFYFKLQRTIHLIKIVDIFNAINLFEIILNWNFSQTDPTSNLPYLINIFSKPYGSKLYSFLINLTSYIIRHDLQTTFSEFSVQISVWIRKNNYLADYCPINSCARSNINIFTEKSAYQDYVWPSSDTESSYNLLKTACNSVSYHHINRMKQFTDMHADWMRIAGFVLKYIYIVHTLVGNNIM